MRHVAIVLVVLIGNSITAHAQVWKLVPDDDAVYYFDASYATGSVDIDGNRAVISSHLAAVDSIPQAGIVYLFEWDGTDYQETARFTPDQPVENGYFGSSVALNGDRLAIGMSSHWEASQSVVIIYEWDGIQWTESGRIESPEGSPIFGDFGSSVDLDGDRIIIGAQRNSALGQNAGSAYIYEWDGATWDEAGQLFPSDVGSQGLDYFGTTVAIEGDVAVVGAIGVGSFGRQAACYIFSYDGSRWKERLKAVTYNPCDDVAISQGRIAMAGRGGLEALIYEPTDTSYVLTDRVNNVWVKPVQSPSKVIYWL